jgi:exodeoxyribonuclease V beta subunit
MSELEARFDATTLELAGKTLVEASAGTGKTHAITTLVVRLVLERELEPSEILIMTFTEAATAELRTRVRRRLLRALAVLEGAAIDREEDPELFAVCERHAGEAGRERMRRAVDNVDEAPITTIHGFCHRVLHEQALGTGTAFASELVPDLEELYDDVLYDFWHARVADSAELVAHLSEAEITADRLRRLLSERRRNPRARLLPNASDPVTALEREFLEHATEESLRRKNARGVLGFDDLLDRVASAAAGPDGAALARSLRQRYKAVLIDEFQDTDPVQWDIMQRVFATGQLPLFLIGDPKQAIYGFRGADVFTYLAAGRDARRSTMRTNWRSDPGLVRAVNRLFSGENPFLIREIEHVEVEARPGAVNVFHAPHASGAASLELLFVERDEPERTVTKTKAERAVARVVANDIARLLHGRASVAGRPLAPSDVAVLTRSNAQCFVIQDALRKTGVHSVVIGDKSVFESDEALDVEVVLLGVLDPASSTARKRALASGIIRERGEAIAELDQDMAKLELWLRRFQRYNRLWTERGFMRMFRELLREVEAAEHLLELQGGERRLTNVLHLAELLQRAASEEHLGPAALVRYLSDQRREGALRGEHAEIRLESDEHAVRILTIHKSKGLEFPVVYCPYTWCGSLVRNDDRPRVLHDDTGEAILDIDLDRTRREVNLERVKREVAAEDLRIAYVALTRAEHRCTIVWGAFSGLSCSAVGYLLHPPPEFAHAELPKTNRLDKYSDDQLANDLAALAERSGGDIALRRVPFTDRGAAVEIPISVKPLQEARTIERRVSEWQRTESFSGLTKHEPSATPDEAARDHDEQVPVPTEPLEPAETAGSAASEAEPILLDGFPRGRRAGDFFHALFEEIDFACVSDEELVVLAADKLEGFGFGRGVDQATRDGWVGRAVAAVRDALETPLAASTLKLAAIPKERRFVELEFRVPVAAAAGATFSADQLASVFRNHPSAEVPATYADRVRALGFRTLSGYLKGFIDLVFEHENRWYVVDYKTNHLGDFVADYDALRMRTAMAESHYFLQYHLYSLAVDRFLRRYQPDYTYDTHFGGVYYLFIKGMRPGRKRGVFFEKPPAARMQALSAALNGGQP